MNRREFLLSITALAACATAPNDASYRVIGRHARTADGDIVIGWPASGVEGAFTGTHLVARIEDNGDNILDLEIDGVSTQLPLDPGVNEYVLFSAPSAGAHIVKLTRRSEINQAPPTTIQAITLDGSWRALPPRMHRIAYFGDSLSVGYGNEGPDQHCSYSAETSAPWKSYASQAARAFDADFQLNAISGRGVMRNYDGGGGMHIPQLIDAAVPDHPEMVWDHARFSPELIVVNLGANDFSTTGPGDGFGPAYAEFLRALRERYPGAHIISAFGPEEKREAIDTIEAAVAAFNQGQARPASFIYLPQASEGHIFGCDWHPGADTHRVMTRALIAKIEADMGWGARE